MQSVCSSFSILAHSFTLTRAPSRSSRWPRSNPACTGTPSTCFVTASSSADSSVSASSSRAAAAAAVPPPDDDDVEAEILANGVSTAFFPHGLGHSLGLDVHDVPSASKPAAASNESDPIYRYLRLRLPLQVGMVVVSVFFSSFCVSRFAHATAADRRTWDLLLPAPACAGTWERVRRPGRPRTLRGRGRCAHRGRRPRHPRRM